MDDPPVFGYGSLILPTSLIARYADVSSVDPIYEAGITGGPDLIRDDAKRVWKAASIDRLPVTVTGFRRYYSVHSPRGGAMLELIHTGDPDDRVNGVLYYGLTDGQRADVDATETGYDRIAVEPTVKPYPDRETVAERGLAVPDEIEVYARSTDDVRAERARNPTYHARIMAGIDTLADAYGPAVAGRFRADFRTTTDERDYGRADPTAFATVAANDRIGEPGWGQ